MTRAETADGAARARPAAARPDDTRGIDFVSDQLESGRRIRACNKSDACTRASLLVTVQHNLLSVAVFAALDSAIAARGQPVGLSLDTGNEFRSRAFDAWAEERGIALAFIQPGEPIQNANFESFNGRLRVECLNQHYFLSLTDSRFHM